MTRNISALSLGGCRFSTGTVPTDKKFIGQRLDSTGLYYYGARYYDATIGRFISPDTITPRYSNPQSLNRYSYCLNNPLRYTDPSGHDCMPPDYGYYLLCCSYYHWNGSYVDWYFQYYRAYPEIQPSVYGPPAMTPLTLNPPQPELIAAAIGGSAITSATIAENAGLAGETAIEEGLWSSLKAGIWGVLVAIMATIPTDSPRNDTMYSKNGGDTVQSGGNTVKPGTAKALNEYSGKNLPDREWGRALEGLKDDNNVPNNDHGKITRDGSYYDNKGEYRGNLNDYTP